MAARNRRPHLRSRPTIAQALAGVVPACARRRTTLALALLLACATGTARAEDDAARRMSELRLDASSERHSQGVWLFAWGATSAVGGGLALAFGHAHEAWVGAGVAAASFGVVNALLSFGLLDLSGAKRRAALELPASDRESLQRLREQHLVEELETGQFYAVNFGLDVFYTSAGVFMVALGRARTPHVEWLQGAGVSVLVQGTFLLVFDLLAWLAANRRADGFRVAF